MRNLTRCILVALFAVNAMDAAHAAQWAKSYVGLGYPASVQSAADGGYIAVGSTLALNAWVLRLNASGEVSWQKTFDGMIGGGVHPTADGGYIMGGEAFSTEGVGSALLLKLDASGNIVWQRSYSDSAATFNYTLEPTIDGGYIATGSRRGGGVYFATLWIMKLHANGDVAWQKTYVGTSGDDAITSARQTADGGYILGGGTSSFGKGSGDAWLMKLNANGEVVWQKTYGGGFGESAASVESTHDGGYVVVGSTTTVGPRANAWVLRLDADGNVIWQKAYGTADLDTGVGSIRETADGGFVMAGGMYLLDSGVATAWVLKMDASGEIVWQWSYGINGRLYADLVLPTADGGYILAGSSSLEDTWVLKLDANGAIPDCGMMRTSNVAAANTSATVGFSTASLTTGTATPTVSGFTQRDSIVIPATQCYYAGPGATVVEFYHAGFDHYFITPVAAEIALLDARVPPFQDWSRTGYSFNAYAPANAPTASVAICRFFNATFAPKSSHFYAAHGFGCEDTIAGFPDWTLEDAALFSTMLPASDGACPGGTISVYRTYNNGMGGAPNHRFVTSFAERQNMINQGWVAEGAGIGVGMCVPQ